MSVLAILFWVAVGMALMFGLWFGALALWKGVSTAATWVGNVWNGAAKALQSDVTAIKNDVASIKTKIGA